MRRALAIIASVSLLVLSTPGTVLGACTKAVQYTDHTPQQSADGARMSWVYRTLNATDIPKLGYASQVMWVGTNGSDASSFFVEVGITHGWQGQNLRTAYTAHWPVGGGYQEARFNFGLVLNATYQFTVQPSTLIGRYNSVISYGGSTWTLGWNSHNPPVVNYSGGPEAKCNTSQINRTYVSVNRYRRASDGAFVTINNGTKTNFSNGAHLLWCSQPVTFRYYLNPSNSPNDCS